MYILLGLLAYWKSFFYYGQMKRFFNKHEDAEVKWKLF